jgi:polar amino acid transport system substrate-binding protein
MKRVSSMVALLYCVGLALNAQALKTELQNTAPKFIKNADGSFSGLILDLMQLIEKNSTITFTYPNQFVPGERIEYNLSNGATDIGFGLMRTPAREKIMTFGATLYNVDYMLVARANDPVTINSIDDVKALGSEGTVLAVLGGSSAKTLTDLGLKVDDTGPDMQTNLVKLLNNRGRFFYYHNLGLVWEMNTTYKGKFKLLPPVIQSVDQWVVFSKNVPSGTSKIVLDTIAKLKASGEWDKVTNKYLK